MIPLRVLTTKCRRRVARFSLCLAIAAIALSAPARAQVSLATVVDLAQRNSTGVRAAMADVKKASAMLAESKDAIVPSVDFGTGLPVFRDVGFTGSPPSIWTATIQSLVYSTPQKRYIDAASLGVEAAKARLKDAREQVALDASTAYIELDIVNQQLEDAHQQEQFAGRLVNIEQQRAEAGVDPLSELLQGKLTSAQIKLRRLHLETRAASLDRQLAALTGLPAGSIRIDHASIPEIPQIHGDAPQRELNGVRAAELAASSKFSRARGDEETNDIPELRFFAQYNRNTTLLNSVNQYFAKALPADNFASGISVQVPFFDLGHHARAHESAADALRARIEAEQAQKQNDLEITYLSGSIQELDAQAEIASLRQQIANEQLKSVLAQLNLGNGTGTGPGSEPQLSPKAEELARIDERQKSEDALDAGFELAKARLGLLRVMGHMEDWLDELHGK